MSDIVSSAVLLDEAADVTMANTGHMAAQPQVLERSNCNSIVSTQITHMHARTHAGKWWTGALLGFGVGRAARQIYEAASQRACSLSRAYFISFNLLSFTSIAFYFICVIH